MRNVRRAVVLLPILSLIATGQALPSSWDGVKTIAPGTEVRVTADNSKPIQGKLEAVTDSNLVIGKSSTAHSFPKSDIHSISIKEKGHRARNVLIGAGAGLAAGLGIGAAIGHDCRGIACGGIDVAVGGLIGLGGGIVAGVELPSGKWRQVYAQQSALTPTEQAGPATLRCKRWGWCALRQYRTAGKFPTESHPTA